jgi:PAS domain S-box-containing protein
VYDPDTRTLTTKHITVSGHVLSAANRLIGHNLIGMVTTVSPEMEKHMLQGMVEIFSDLSEITFGAIPKPIALTIKNTLGIGKFTGMALVHGGKLIGTAIIAQREEQPGLDIEVCKTLAHVSAVSIQRRKTEIDLHESENKFRAIIENLSEGIFLLGENGYLLEWNPAQEALTGFKREEVLNKPVWDVQLDTMPEHLRTPENRENAKQLIQHMLATGESPYFQRPMEVTIYSKGGGTKQVVQKLFPIQTDTGYRIGSLVRDISARKQAENDRNRLIEEMKSKNTELEQFTYTVSHDLKAPLITIKGFLGLLETDALAGNLERMKQDIFRITEATNRMQRLLNELLELSRIGRVVNPSQAATFKEIVQDAAVAVRGRLDARNINMTIEDGLPTVFIDRTRIVQVVQNLLDNAAKFMGNQSNPQIIVGTQGSDKDGKPILFVKDNGIGIEPKQIGMLFGLFRKLDANAEGTGIGLVLVKRIIEVHGGRVWITSDGLGHGTTVWFTLPTS